MAKAAHRRAAFLIRTQVIRAQATFASVVAEAATKNVTQAQLAQWMVGHGVDAAERQPTQVCGGVVCSLERVSTARHGREYLRDVSLALHAGEIVAIAGVSGNGQAALANLLCGMLSTEHGSVTFLDACLLTPAGDARCWGRFLSGSPSPYATGKTWKSIATNINTYGRMDFCGVRPDDAGRLARNRRRADESY